MTAALPPEDVRSQAATWTWNTVRRTRTASPGEQVDLVTVNLWLEEHSRGPAEGDCVSRVELDVTDGPEATPDGRAWRQALRDRLFWRARRAVPTGFLADGSDARWAVRPAEFGTGLTFEGRTSDMQAAWAALAVACALESMGLPHEGEVPRWDYDAIDGQDFEKGWTTA